MNNEETIKTYITCDCGSELLVVDDIKEFNEIFLSMWTHELSKISWRERIRLAWRCLKHGGPYTDQLILSTNGARVLVNALKEAIRRRKPEESWGLMTVDVTLDGPDE